MRAAWAATGWFLGGLLLLLGLLACSFVLLVAIPFDEVEEGPRWGTRALLLLLAATFGAGSAACGGQGIRALRRLWEPS